MTSAVQTVIHRKFGVIKLWPGIQVAEDENIQRIKRSASSLNIECLELDWQGRLIDDPYTKMTADELDFVIHLHFETPKVYDIFSFYTLWNPPRFFHDWGYEKYSDNLLTHDDYLSCGSPKADQMIMRRVAGDPFFSSDFCTMYHSLSGPVLEPTLGSLKLFYVGINWERVNNSKGRHHDLIRALDDKSLVKIYGPTKLNGTRVWKGFKNYVGELPFDGISCVRAIHDAGIGLVLSSEAHNNAEMASNRIFEAVAAGVMVISDKNAFIRKHFADTVLYIDTDLSLSGVIEQIEAHIAWIKINPQKAFEKIRKAQQIFLEKFNLNQSIEAIYRALPNRKSLANRGLLSDPGAILPVPEPVNLYFCLPWDCDADLEEICRTIKHQTYRYLNCFVLVDESFSDIAKIRSMAAHHDVMLEIRTIRFFYDQNMTYRRNRGEMILELMARDSSMSDHPWICFIEPHEKIFSDHVARLLAAVACGQEAAVCPVIFYDSKSDDRQTHGVLWPVTYHLFAKYPIGTASMLFRWSDTQDRNLSVMEYLDRLTLLGLCREKNPKRTIKPTVLIDTNHPWASMPSKTTVAQELSCLRDLNPWQIEVETQHASFVEDGNIPRLDQFLLKNLSIKQKRRIFFKLLKPALIPHWLYTIRDMFRRKRV